MICLVSTLRKSFAFVVTGFPGMLSTYVTRNLIKDFPFAAIYITGRRDCDLVEKMGDFLSRLKGLVSSYPHVVVINCAGVIPQKGRSLEEAQRINTCLPVALGAFMELVSNLSVFHITTDCVFDGTLAFPSVYTEDSVRDATSAYGLTKIQGEVGNLCTIRTSIVGREGKGPGVSLLEVALRDEPMEGYSNHFWNGVTCYQLAQSISSILNSGKIWKGIRHLYSPPLSKYSLLKLMRKTYGLEGRVRPTTKNPGINRALGSKFSLGILAPPFLEVQLDQQKRFDEYYPIEDIIKRYNDAVDASVRRETGESCLKKLKTEA